MKYIRICPTNGCGNEISYSRKDSYKNAEGKNCICAKCNRAKRGAVYSKFLDDSVINLVLSVYYDKKKTLTSVIAESTPHLKRGALRDFKNILQDHNYWKEDNWNATDSIYTFETGSQIEFFSADQSDKLRGARRDRCFMNEANNMSLDAFDQLEVRTKDFIFLDYNPTNEFWVYTDVMGKREDVEHIILTYKDNEALSPEIIQSIEARKGRKGWWQVYGEGQLGELEGKIYKDWEIIDEVPHHAKLERYGLDFGYSNDPSSIIAVYYYNGGYVLDEIIYQKGMSNKQIADAILNNIQALVIADSAEPKSIDDIKGYGVSILPAEKGPDSVRNGIQLVQDQRISVTKRSLNIIKEYRNYLWETDRDGKILQTPEHQFSHSMDAIRYALVSLIKKPVFKMVASAPAQPFYGDREMGF
jgi:phage terminase large subunit